MSSELAASSNRTAQALCRSLRARLEGDDELATLGVYRSIRALRTLVDAAGGAEEGDLRRELDDLRLTLTLRVGEEVDAEADEDVFNLARALGVLAAEVSHRQARYRR